MFNLYLLLKLVSHCSCMVTDAVLSMDIGDIYN